MRPRSFQYEQNTNDLKVEVLAADFQSLNTLKEKALEKGLVIDIGSTSSDTSGIKGKLEVRVQ